MSAPPHFNPAESLIPDVKGSIGGVQGGGGGQTTFLKDLLTVLKGRVIQYKNPNDTASKSYVVSEILEVSSVPEEIKTEPKKVEETKKVEEAKETKEAKEAKEAKESKTDIETKKGTTYLDLESYKKTAFREIGALNITNISGEDLNKTKKLLKDAVAKANDILYIKGLLSALKKINSTNVQLIKVAAAAAAIAKPPPDIIKAIIKVLDKQP
jgi:hypothetical protein